MWDLSLGPTDSLWWHVGFRVCGLSSVVRELSHSTACRILVFQPRGQTHILWIARQILNHRTTREVPITIVLSHCFCGSIFVCLFYKGDLRKLTHRLSFELSYLHLLKVYFFFKDQLKYYSKSSICTNIPTEVPLRTSTT